MDMDDRQLLPSFNVSAWSCTVLQFMHKCISTTWDRLITSLGIRKSSQARPRGRPRVHTRTHTPRREHARAHTQTHTHTHTGQKLINSRDPPESFSLFCQRRLPRPGGREAGGVRGAGRKSRGRRELGAGRRCAPRPLLPGESPGRVLRRVPGLVSRPPAAAAV